MLSARCQPDASSPPCSFLAICINASQSRMRLYRHDQKPILARRASSSASSALRLSSSKSCGRDSMAAEPFLFASRPRCFLPTARPETERQRWLCDRSGADRNGSSAINAGAAVTRARHLSLWGLLLLLSHNAAVRSEEAVAPPGRRFGR